MLHKHRFKIKAIGLTTLFSFLMLGACSDNSSLSGQSFDWAMLTKENIQEQFNDENHDYFEYLNYSFFTYENLNHVLSFNGKGNIFRHDSFKKEELTEANIQKIEEGDSLLDVVSKIGLPSFEGIQKDTSLDFAQSETILCRVFFKADHQELSVQSTEMLDKEEPETWFDVEKQDLPSLQEAQKIKVGMSLDHIVSILGKPQRDIGYGANIFEFNLTNKQKVDVWFINNVQLENKYHEQHSSKVYGTHYYYAVRIQIGSIQNS